MSKYASSKYSYKDMCAYSCLNVSRLISSIYNLLIQVNDKDILDVWRAHVRAVSEFRDALDEKVSKDLPF